MDVGAIQGRSLIFWTLALAATALLRFIHIDGYELTGDEWVQFNLWDPSHPPLALVMARVPAYFSQNLGVARAFLSLFGVLNALALGWYVQRISRDVHAGWMAALLMGLSMFHLQLGQTPKGYVFMMLFSTLAALALVEACAGTPRSARAWWAFSAFSALSIWSEIFAVTLVAADIAWLLADQSSRRSVLALRRPFAPVGLGVLAVLPLLSHAMAARQHFLAEPANVVWPLLSHAGEILLGLPGFSNLALAVLVVLIYAAMGRGRVESPDLFRLLTGVAMLVFLRSSGIHVEGRHLSLIFPSWLSVLVVGLLLTPPLVRAIAFAAIVLANLTAVAKVLDGRPVSSAYVYDYYQRLSPERPYSVGLTLARRDPPTRAFLVAQPYLSQFERFASGLAGSYLFFSEGDRTVDRDAQGRRRVMAEGTDVIEVVLGEGTTITADELRVPGTIVYSSSQLDPELTATLMSACRQQSMREVFPERTSLWVCGPSPVLGSLSAVSDCRA